MTNALEAQVIALAAQIIALREELDRPLRLCNRDFKPTGVEEDENGICWIQDVEPANRVNRDARDNG